jgi:hypothetical protein
MKTLTLVFCVFFCASGFSQDYASLRSKLETMYQTDQQYRIILDSLVRKQKLEWSSPEVQHWIPIAMQQDSANLASVKNILDQFGWIGMDKIGPKANETLFLIIQHADSITMAS